MLRMRLAGSVPFVDRFQANHGHQAPDAMTSVNRALAAQIGCNLARSEKRVFGEHPFDLFHHRQSVRVDADRCVVERRPRQPH